MSTTKPLPHHTDNWTGYTLDELRYMRAYTAARIEINRERVHQRVDQIVKTGKNGFTPSGMLGRVMGAMSYIDLAILAWKISSKSFKLFRSFRR